MPDAFDTDFSLAQNITDKAKQKYSPDALLRSATKVGRMKVISGFINEHRPNSAVPDITLIMAIRQQEQDPRARDLSVGDAKDRTRAAEYRKLTPEQKYARRDEFNSWGSMQIGKGIIADVNETFGTNYTHEDAFDRIKSIELFRLYMARYSKENWTQGEMAQKWNPTEKTGRYVREVLERKRIEDERVANSPNKDINESKPYRTE